LQAGHDVNYSTPEGPAQQIDIDGSIWVDKNTAGECLVKCKDFEGRIEIEFDGFIRWRAVGYRRSVEVGIFVAVNGFSPEAERRGQKAGMTFLMLDDLRLGRMGAQFFRAMQSTIFIVPIGDASA
jgi:hypothetical protein